MWLTLYITPRIISNDSARNQSREDCVLAAYSDRTPRSLDSDLLGPYDTGLGRWPLLGALELKICDTFDLHTGI